jgi:hypothetical protein
MEGAPLLEDRGGEKGVIPDLVIVFPRPEVTRETDSCMSLAPDTNFTAKQIEQFFDEVLVDRDKSEAGVDAKQDAKAVGDIYPRCSKLEETVRERETSGSKEQTPMVEVQNAMIEDMIRWMATKGLTTFGFRSCDKDELFICISLGDCTKPAQMDPVAMSFAEDAGTKLQTTFDSVTGDKKLHIKQEMEPFEELYLPYNKDYFTAIEQTLNFPPMNDEASLREKGAMRKYHDGLAGVNGSVLRTVDRARIVMTLINGFVDLEDALGLGLITNFYVPHKLSKLEEFRSGKKKGADAYDYEHDAWSNFYWKTIMLGLRFWKASEQQPIQEIRDYFGEQVAFYFLWLGYTLRGLIIALPFTIISFFAFTYFQLLRGKGDDSPKYCEGKEATLYLIVAAVFCIGAKLYFKFWLRLQAHYAELWSISSTSISDTHRPDYRGDLKANPLDQNRKTREYPAYKAMIAKTTVAIVTVLFITAVCAAVAGIYMVQGKIQDRLAWALAEESEFADMTVAAGTCAYPAYWDEDVCLQKDISFFPTFEEVGFGDQAEYDRAYNSYKTCCKARKYAKSAASAIFSAQICIFQIIWGIIHLKLIELANPKTYAEAKDMAVQLLFPFSFVSTYANIFFHAVYAVWDEPCFGVNCLNVMRPAMYMVVLPAIAVQVASMLVPYALYRYALISEVKELKKTLQKAETDTIDRSFIEVQNKRPDFTSVEINNDMNVMFILLGYLLLFGWAAPGITLFILITFLLKIRIDAFKLCSVHQRIIPGFNCDGIGEWNDVMRSIIVLGRWTAFIIPVVNLPYFNKHSEESTLTWLFQGGLGEPGAEATDGQHGLTWLQKVVFVFLCKEAVDRICSVVDGFIPDKSNATKLMAAKREKMRVKLASRLARAKDEADDADSTTTELKSYIKKITEGTESTIKGVQERNLPTLDSANSKWNDYEHSDFAPADKKKTYFGQDPVV